MCLGIMDARFRGHDKKDSYTHIHRVNKKKKVAKKKKGATTFILRKETFLNVLKQDISKCA